MDVWAFDDNVLYNKKDKDVYTYLKNQTRNQDLAVHTAKLLDLYRYLTTHSFTSPTQIYASIFLDSAHKEHAFTPEEATQVYELLHAPQEGGALLPENPDVLDAIILRWVYFIRNWTPSFITDTVDELSPYIFILKGMEENAEYGALLGVALDATEAGLKTTAGAIQSLSPVIVGLLPLPEAGPIGAVLGWMVSSVFTVLLLGIHVSRRHFGQAFIASFGLIPIAGQSLYNAAMSGERFLTKTTEKRQRLIENTRIILGDEIGDTLESVLPDPLALIPGTEAPAPVAGKRFSKKHGKKPKWRTLRNRSKKRSVNGSR
jgi:hypothetical protein